MTTSSLAPERHQLLAEQFGGELMGPDDHRYEELRRCHIPTVWVDTADTDANIAWTRETFVASEPFPADGRWLNYYSDDEPRDALRAHTASTVHGWPRSSAASTPTTGLSDEQVQARFEERAPHYRRVPGLVEKLYLRYRDSGEFGAVYVWESEDALKRFRESELGMSIAAAYAVRSAPRFELADVELVVRPREARGADVT